VRPPSGREQRTEEHLAQMVEEEARLEEEGWADNLFPVSLPNHYCGGGEEGLCDSLCLSYVRQPSGGKAGGRLQLDGSTSRQSVGAGGKVVSRSRSSLPMRGAPKQATTDVGRTCFRERKEKRQAARPRSGRGENAMSSSHGWRKRMSGWEGRRKPERRSSAACFLVSLLSFLCQELSGGAQLRGMRHTATVPSSAETVAAENSCLDLVKVHT